MGKLLLLLVVVAGVVLLLRNYQRSLARQQDPAREADPPAPTPEGMGRCARCGVHVPRSEGFLSDGRFFCTEEHLRLGSSDDPSRHG